MKGKILYGFLWWKIIFLQREIITRKNGEPYLNRFTVFKTPWLGLFIHMFEASDDICLHDHPWSFITIVLRGYYEETPKRIKWIGPGIYARLAPHPHRVILGKEPSLTIMITGPLKRKWGFYTPFGWIHWKAYSHEVHCGT